MTECEPVVRGHPSNACFRCGVSEKTERLGYSKFNNGWLCPRCASGRSPQPPAGDRTTIVRIRAAAAMLGSKGDEIVALCDALLGPRVQHLNSGSPQPPAGDPSEDEEESCAEAKSRLAVYDRIGLEAANAIKASDHWADNHWPSPADRLWYIAAQEEIKALRAALRGGSHQPEETTPSEVACEAAQAETKTWAIPRTVPYGLTCQMLRAAYAAQFGSRGASPQEPGKPQ